MPDLPQMRLPDETPCDACRGTGRIEVQGEITTYPGRLVRCHACRGLGAKKEPSPMTTPDRPYANVPADVAERVMGAGDKLEAASVRLSAVGDTPGQTIDDFISAMQEWEAAREEHREALRAAREAEKVTVESVSRDCGTTEPTILEALEASGYEVGE